MNKFVSLIFILLICATSSFASIIIENRNYSEISFKFIDSNGSWVDKIIEARSFNEIKMNSTKIKINTDNMFVEYKLYSNNVYTFFIDKEDSFWDIKKVTDSEELLPYIQRGMIKTHRYTY